MDNFQLATVIVPKPLVAQAKLAIGRLYLGPTATEAECAERGSGYFSVPIKRNPNAQITHYMSSGAFTSEEIAIMEQDCPWVGSLDKTHNWEWVCNGKPDPETGQMTGPNYTVVFDNES